MGPGSVWVGGGVVMGAVRVDADMSALFAPSVAFEAIIQFF